MFITIILLRKQAAFFLKINAWSGKWNKEGLRWGEKCSMNYQGWEEESGREGEKCVSLERKQVENVTEEGLLNDYAVYPSSQGQKNLLKSSNAIGGGFRSGNQWHACFQTKIKMFM